jgi:hypothetical protein
MQSAETRGAGSSVAQSFAKLEKYGITQTRIALLAAILLDAIPFITSLILSLLGETRRQEQAPGKRRATPNLRAVA